MSLNWREIDLILEELHLENSSIQKIRQPDFKTLVLDLYAPGNRQSLFISLAQGKTRLHRLTRSFKNQVPLQRFAQFLRSRIKGGKIRIAEQIGGERIVRLEISRGGETTLLYIRLWGGAANIIATDSSNIILDAFYRRPKRHEISGEYFNPQELIATAKAKTTGDTPPKKFIPRENPTSMSFNQFIEQEYFNREIEQELGSLRERAETLHEKQIANIDSKLAELQRKSYDNEELEGLKQTGDLIMANLHLIQPGSKWVRLDDFYHENAPTEIELDPTLSPQQNGEAYYNKYRKAKRQREHLTEELANLKQSKRQLQQQAKQIDAIEGPEEQLQALKEFISQYSPKKGEKTGTAAPGLRFQSGQFTILVGRTAKENDALLRHYVRGNDYWLHTRDYPGGYVFIKYISGKSVPLETLLDAGNLALHYSKGRTGGKAELYYTQVKYLRRAKEGPQGLVIPTQEKNISIELDEERIQRLLGS
ncbi:MAG: NFACT family protein [Spirochaetia bacterium]|nr:NFACT family protein [Spirochaetia bacterium]